MKREEPSQLNIPEEEQLAAWLEGLQPYPSERFHRRMGAAPWAQPSKSLEGEQAMNPDHVWQRRLRVLALAALAALVVTAGLLSPRGQALARGVFRFFTSIEGESFPLPTDQVRLLGEEPTVAPTFEAELKSVETTPTATQELAASTPEADPTQAAEAGCEDTLALLTYPCQVSRAEAASGFDAKEPPGDMPGLVFSSASGNPVLQLLELKYSATSGGSELVISQGRSGSWVSSWGEIPSSADVEEVKVGQYDGEYVQGMFVVKPGATSATWEADGAVRRLRWQEGDMLFELTLMGHTASVEWLEKDTMVALAASLTYTPATGNELRADYLTSVEDAETLAGFDLMEPSVLPEGFAFSYADYDATAQRVRMVYELGNRKGFAALVIFQTPVSAAPETDPATLFPPGTVESVQIGNLPGQYIAGSYEMFTGTPVPGAPTPTPVWHPEDPHRALVWRADGLQIELNFISSQWYGGRLEKADMIVIAENME